MTNPSLLPLILDFDRSVLPVAAEELRIPLHHWQDAIRFGCTLRAFKQLDDFLQEVLPEKHGCVFMGSGDYHHLSTLLLSRLSPKKAPVDLVVCDNHPDNMRYPFGIHCGSWISHASRMAHIRQIHVIGISSADITLPHAWENRLRPLLKKKLTYWSLGARATWLNVLGLASQHRCFASADELLQAFVPCLTNFENIYLSVDKDVFSTQTITTHWDQGAFSKRHGEQLIAACTGKLVGADVCGDVSEYSYRGWLKKFLSQMDGQRQMDLSLLPGWQEEHRRLNTQLLAWICPAMQKAQGVSV